MEVTLGFRGEFDDVSSEPVISHIRKIITGLKGMISSKGIDSDTLNDVLYLKFSLIGSNKVDVAYKLEQMVNPPIYKNLSSNDQNFLSGDPATFAWTHCGHNEIPVRPSTGNTSSSHSGTNSGSGTQGNRVSVSCFRRSAVSYCVDRRCGCLRFHHIRSDAACGVVQAKGKVSER